MPNILQLSELHNDSRKKSDYSGIGRPGLPALTVWNLVLMHPSPSGLATLHQLSSFESQPLRELRPPATLSLLIESWLSYSGWMIKNNKIRVGLIGYGYAGKTFHGPLIRSVPGLELHVIGSSKREILEAEIPGVLVCSVAEVPAHPDVDLVVIASPNESHFPLAAAALHAGKDVVV